MSVRGEGGVGGKRQEVRRDSCLGALCVFISVCVCAYKIKIKSKWWPDRRG